MRSVAGGPGGAIVLLIVLGSGSSSISAAVGAAPSGAADHHAVVDSGLYPWSAVGKLFNSVGGACTAVAISRDTVLTAAHCLYAFRTRRFLRPDAIHFLLGYARGDYRIHARVARFAVGRGYDPADEARTAAADWALLTLAEPLPAEVRPVAVARAVPSPGTVIAIGGFAQDRAYLMTADTRCHLLATRPGRPAAGGARPAAILDHDCLIAHGDSGAPLLVTAGDGTVEAFAVTVGFWTGDGRHVGIAAPVTDAILPTAEAPPAGDRP